MSIPAIPPNIYSIADGLAIYFEDLGIAASETRTFSSEKFLTHLMPLVSFYTPWKYPQTSGFLMPQACNVIKKEHLFL